MDSESPLQSSVGSSQWLYVKGMPSPQAVLVTGNIVFPVPVILQSYGPLLLRVMTE